MKHPANDMLAAFAAASLADPEMETIGKHVSECDTCADKIDALAHSVEPLAAQLGEKLLGQLAPEKTRRMSPPADIPTPSLADEATQRFDRDPPAQRHAPWKSTALPVLFGRYRVLQKLGEGGMGVVYLADDTQLARQVALKIPFFDDKPGRETMDRFHREAKAMATVLHPNVCPIYDVGHIDGIHFLTMAYLEGRPLSDYLKTTRRQTNRQVAIIIRKLALALQSAHDAGIVHRDLKPENILIRKDHEPVVTDFGLAMDVAQTRLTHHGTLVGTPAYMAPEQIEGEQADIGPTTDIYALGVILYQMICGRLPYEGSLREVLARISQTAPLAPREVRSDVDLHLEAICLKAMARNRSDRYQSAGLMAEDLGRFLKGRIPTALSAANAGDVREFTVECPLCAARLAVTSEQIGQPVRCKNCQSWAVVETPAASGRRDVVEASPDQQEESTGAMLMLRAGEAAGTSSHSNPAAEALRRAEAAIPQQQPSPLSTAALFFSDEQLIIRWLALSLVLQIEAALFEKIWIISAFVGAPLCVAMAVTGMVVLGSAARGEDRIMNWPAVQIVGWIRAATPVISSTMLALFVGWILGQAMSFFSPPHRALVVSLMCGASIATLLPLLLMSALEVGFPTPVLSLPVLRSLRQAPTRWAWFCAQSTCLVALAMLGWQLRSFESLAGNFFSAAVATAAILILANLLGKLLSEVAPWCVNRIQASMPLTAEETATTEE